MESKEFPKTSREYPSWKKLSNTAKSLLLATLLTGTTVSCEEEEPLDTKAPTIEFYTDALHNIEIGSKIEVKGGDVYIGGKLAADCEDDQTSCPTTTFTVDGKTISTIEKDGTLVVVSIDQAGNQAKKQHSITVKETPETNKAPEITIKKLKISIMEPQTITIGTNDLKIGNDTVATWTDDHTERCNVEVTFNEKEVKSGETVNESGELEITVTDNEGVSSTEKVQLVKENPEVNNAPEITLQKDSIDITEPKILTISDTSIKIGDEIIATGYDDHNHCTMHISFNNQELKSGATISEQGTYKLWSTDEKGQKSNTVEIQFFKENTAPTIEYSSEFPNGSTIYTGGGVKITRDGGKLMIETQGKKQTVLTVSDKETPAKDLELKLTLNGKDITDKLGAWITEGGELKFTFSDKGIIDGKEDPSRVKPVEGNYKFDATIQNEKVLSGLDKLNSLQLKVGTPVDLLNGVKSINGWTISKVEIEQNGQRTEISSPNNYTPAQEGTAVIVVSCTTEAGVTYEVKSNQIEVKENVKEYNAVIPAKAESMYQKFNTTNDRAFERRGAYETKALAQSLKNRNACKVLIYREGIYTGDNSIYERIGGNGDGHGEEVYRNIQKGSGTTNNILATKSTRIDVENNINNSSLKDQPIIITTSQEVLGKETLDEFLSNPKYKSFKNLGNKPNILIFAASCNTSKGRNYTLHESITDKSKFFNGLYAQGSATDTDNGIIAVEYGISKNISKHGVYEGNHKTTSSAFISKDYHIIPRNCTLYPVKTVHDNEERTCNNTSFAAPAAAAMARNVYDICHSLGIVEHLQEVRFLMEKYANLIPSTREDIAPDGTIIEDVPNGYVYTMNLLDLINNEVFPAIEKKCTSVNGECTILYTPTDGLQLAYQGAGVEYQDYEGNWIDTNGINPKDYVNRPQRVNYALRAKTYKNEGGITIYCMVPDGVLDYGNKEGGYIVKKDKADIPTN